MNKKIYEVQQWILKHHPEIDQITPDLDLVDNRLIDSLRFSELIFLLEQLSGESIDTSNLNIDAFRSLKSIAENFLKESELAN